MRNSIAVSFTARRGKRLRGCVARIAFSAFAAAAILATGGGSVAAQEPAGQPAAAVEQAARPAAREIGRWELLIPSGTMVPTGAQGDAIRRGGMSALQISYVPRPSLAFTATAGWVRSRDVATDGAPKLDVFTYDVGAELRRPALLRRGIVAVTPFVGAGAGARSYNHRKLDVDATHNAAAYGALGADVGIGRVHVRVEARDYVTGFRPLIGDGDTAAHNDVAVLFGLRLATR